MTLPRRDAQYHTYGDYLIWSRTSGDELIDGTAYVKEPPSPSLPHQMIAGELYRQACNALKGTPWKVFIAPLDVRLPKSTERDEEVDTVVQPDVFITGDRQKLDYRGMRGAPDWLAEVLSPSTAGYDRTVKIAAYERAGVSGVWLINPGDRTVAIYRLEEGHYGRPTIQQLSGKTHLAAVPGVIINWDSIVTKILDDPGQ
ncbi:MAG TPA: Uma2 family endonuclease [Steroidobacteraceae bacterium]|nr:Uma2 family endonuclease [Steroidobacteraceae bacterium]